MKKFWIWLGTGLFSFLVLAILIAGGTLLIMSGVHKHSVKDEFYTWFPSLEKTVETEETSKDEDIVIEDETQTEDETVGEESGDQTSEEITGDETSGGEVSEENQTEGTEQTEDETQTE